MTLEIHPSGFSYGRETTIDLTKHNSLFITLSRESAVKRVDLNVDDKK